MPQYRKKTQSIELDIKLHINIEDIHTHQRYFLEIYQTICKLQQKNKVSFPMSSKY